MRAPIPSLPLSCVPAWALALVACSGGSGETQASATESTAAATATATAATDSATTTGVTATTTTTNSGSGTYAPTIDDQGCLERCGELDLCIDGACAPRCHEGSLFGDDGIHAFNCPDFGGCYSYETCSRGCQLIDGVATCTPDPACSPVDLGACPVDACVQSWSYACPGCGIEFDRSACFAISEGCTYPWLACDLPKPCPRVWAHSAENFGTLEVFEAESAAICLLQTLQSGVLAKHEILWGEMTDEGVTVMEVLVDGKGGATFQWVVDCQGCPESGRVGRSGRLALQPAAYFDECLAAPTTASLLQCIYGFTAFQEGQGPVDGYTPPWTTGMCSALEFACPTP